MHRFYGCNVKLNKIDPIKTYKQQLINALAQCTFHIVNKNDDGVGGLGVWSRWLGVWSGWPKCLE